MRTWGILFVLAAAAALPATASACSDSGPPNDCNDGGAAWIQCAVHDDCPGEQLCHQNGYCLCGSCQYGEECTSEGCRCAYDTPPNAPPGCEVRQNSCGGYGVHCPVDGGSGPRCTTDGAIPQLCESDADCPDFLRCTASGVCDCPTGTGRPDGGVTVFDGGVTDGGGGACSVSRRGHASLGGLGLLLGGALLFCSRRARS